MFLNNSLTALESSFIMRFETWFTWRLLLEYPYEISDLCSREPSASFPGIFWVLTLLILFPLLILSIYSFRCVFFYRYAGNQNQNQCEGNLNSNDQYSPCLATRSMIFWIINALLVYNPLHPNLFVWYLIPDMWMLGRLSTLSTISP